MRKNLVLLCGPGAMQGVFCAGVLTAFENARIYNHIRVCYGVSAGAMDLAYFLARQTPYGSTIYLEDLTGRQFIRRNRVFTGIFWRWIHKHVVHIPLRMISKPVDIDYLFDDIIRNKKPLDVERLHKKMRTIPFKILVADPSNGKVRFIDARKNTIAKLKASCSIIPYYNRATILGNKSFIDPSVITPFAARKVIKSLHTSDKLVVIANFGFRRGKKHEIMASIESWVASQMFEGVLPALMKRRFKQLAEELVLLSNTPGCKIISPLPYETIKPDTTDPVLLHKLYSHGIERGQDFIKTLDL